MNTSNPFYDSPYISESPGMPKDPSATSIALMKSPYGGRPVALRRANKRRIRFEKKKFQNIHANYAHDHIIIRHKQ